MSKPCPCIHTTGPNNRVGLPPTTSVVITRDLGRARDAYKERGVEASRAAHDGVRPSHELQRSSTFSDTATDTASSRSEISELPSPERYRPIVGTRRSLEKHSNTPSEYIKSMVRASVLCTCLVFCTCLPRPAPTPPPSRSMHLAAQPLHDG